jgi:serine/threonine protein kinase
MSPLNEEIPLDPALAALAPGSRIAGDRFTLVRVLGQGGMGVVWLARDDHLRESVALKFLPPEIRHDAVALDDLRRETSRNRKLTHLHIIRIHDLYKVEQAFISMEYVDGPNLSELRLEKTNRVLKWTFLEPLVKQLCDALEYAHKESIIHRDLKPANVMLDGRGRLKLADFGIAAVVSDSVSRVSMGRHGLSGTASYMSPQQLDGQPPQVTDDVYSLGSTLYELLTSRAPFFTGDIAHQVRTMPPQSIEKRLEQLRIANQVPLAVSATVMACLAKDPAKRPQSARALAEHMGLQSRASEIRSAGERPPITEASPETRPEPPQPDTTPAEKLRSVPASQSRAEPGRTPARRPRRARKRQVPLVPIVALVALIAAAAGGWWWWSQSHPKSVLTPKTTAVPVPEFISLFNGRDFAGWYGDPQVWSVKDGAITATGGTSEEHRPKALFWRDGTVEDFELRLSFRLHAGNSGIYYRAKELLEYHVGGYQFEVNGNETGNFLESGMDRRRRDPGRRGSVTINGLVDGKEKVIVQRAIDSADPDAKITFHYDEWYDAVIIVQGNHIIQKLNGRTLSDATDNNENRPRAGTIALEVYGSTPTVVQYRDIRLKRLPSADSASPKQR